MGARIEQRKIEPALIECLVVRVVLEERSEYESRPPLEKLKLAAYFVCQQILAVEAKQRQRRMTDQSCVVIERFVATIDARVIQRVPRRLPVELQAARPSPPRV